jgi:transcriptional regulator with GAF, ATPase, and Fis domain
MNITDMDFFHQATMRICGSLDIDMVLSECLSFFKPYMPINGITMTTIEEQTNTVKTIASKIENGSVIHTLRKPFQLDASAMDYIKKHIKEPVQIVNEPKNNPASRQASEIMGDPIASVLVLKLIVEKKLIGTVLIMANGHHRYNDNHARLLSLLHDPFAVAMSNTLKHQELTRLKDQLADDNRYLNFELRQIVGDKIIGQNNGLKEVMEMVKQVAPLSNQVLILGETGTGKEVVANAIHYSSPRAKGPFIKVNCGAIPESLMDSELFGHEKGAFTGATKIKRGRFERAHKGTIFLDEIGELPPSAQIRLLRVIQNREIERIGGTSLIPLDIRIIAATHRNLEDMVRTGQFREDLWFRLNVFPITIPPLRHRKMDIPALVNYFI